MSGGQLSGGQLSGGQLSGGQLSGGQLSGGQFSGVNCRGGQLSGGQLSGGQLLGGQLSGGQLSPTPLTTTHIDNIATKKQQLYACNAKECWTQRCNWIYKKKWSDLYSLHSYILTIWVRALLNKQNLTKLERVQALALKIMAGAFSSTNLIIFQVLETPKVMHLREQLDFKVRLQRQDSRKPPPPPQWQRNK